MEKPTKLIPLLFPERIYTFDLSCTYRTVDSKNEPNFFKKKKSQNEGLSPRAVAYERHISGNMPHSMETDMASQCIIN